MSANRRRHINALPGIKLLMGFTVGTIALLTGLGYVYCQNQLHRMSDEKGKLEREYQRLQTLTEAVEVTVAKLSSPQELKKKFDNGFFKLNEITTDRIVRIGPATPGFEGKELRAISNERGNP